MTKPIRPCQLRRPQVSHPLWWVPASRGFFTFLGIIRRHFLACEDIAGGSDLSVGGTFFCKIRWPVRWVPAVRWRNNYFARNKEALPCGRRGPSCQPLHVQYSSDGSRPFTTLTTLTTPCRAHPRWWTMARARKGTVRSRGRCGSGYPRGVEYEGSLVRQRCEAAIAAGPGQRWE